MDDDDEPIIQRPDETRSQPPRAVPPLNDPGADVHALHEEERVRVLPDGTVVHETDRVEQEQSWFRRNLPWILMGVCLVLLVGGLVIWYVTRSDTKTVPTVIGLQVDEAINRLQDDGFEVQIHRQPNDTRPAGVVFSANPGAGTNTDKGTTVQLFVSSGKRTKAVPNGVGRPQADARDALVQAGFSVTTAQVFSDQPNGTVVAQDPPAGTRVAPGTKVRINVSKGAADIEIPDEVGSTVGDATAALEAKGFKVATTVVPSDEVADTVISQSPPGGAAPKGSTVHLNVSQGPATGTTTTPTVPTTTDTTATVTTPTTPTTTDTTATLPGSPG
jgi:beta-lactam-binding protein with PASTA domain